MTKNIICDYDEFQEEETYGEILGVGMDESAS